MIQEQNRRAYRLQLQTGAKTRRGSAYGWEMRQSFAWIWFLPLLAVAGSLLFTWFIYWLESHSQAPGVNTIHHKVVIVLDYIHPLRNTLELLLPILSVFLATDLLLKEWRRGTLMLLTTRQSLLWFLVVRSGYLIGYLTLVTGGAILLSWWLTPNLPSSLNMGVWLWQTLLTVMAPTLFLMALGLLVAHLSVNSIAGYVLPACCWLANWLYALQVEQAHTQSSILSYLLFGWSDKDLTPYPDAWLPGKILLCLAAALLLTVQPLLLRKMALQRKDVE
ncbi:MAG TPA: hypothetical protein VKV19_07790 [Ktedonobacteraceae bacterium]|nr:hypothetical protein [Ktedonobacteraceae bacterium]